MRERIERELDLQRQLTQDAQRREDAERQARRKMRRLAGFLLAAALLVSVLGLLSVMYAQRANESARTARALQLAA